jgi:hypothetical protein
VSPSVGLAFINVTTNEAVLSQICDSQFYVKTLHKIQMYEPSTILMVNTAFPPNPKSNLLSVLEENLEGTDIEGLDRKYWSETTGLEFIHALAFREDLEAIQVGIQGNFYATCSFSAVSIITTRLWLGADIVNPGHKIHGTCMSSHRSVPFPPHQIPTFGEFHDDRHFDHPFLGAHPESAKREIEGLPIRFA